MFCTFLFCMTNLCDCFWSFTTWKLVSVIVKWWSYMYYDICISYGLQKCMVGVCSNFINLSNQLHSLTVGTEGRFWLFCFLIWENFIIVLQIITKDITRFLSKYATCHACVRKWSTFSQSKHKILKLLHDTCYLPGHMQWALNKSVLNENS